MLTAVAVPESPVTAVTSIATLVIPSIVFKSAANTVPVSDKTTVSFATPVTVPAACPSKIEATSEAVPFMVVARTFTTPVVLALRLLTAAASTVASVMSNAKA